MAYEKKLDRKPYPRRPLKEKETGLTETPTPKIIPTPSEKQPETLTQMTTKTETVSQTREPYEPEAGIWKRWRCACGRVNTVTKLFVTNHRLEPGDFFKVSCACGGWEMVFSIPARLRKV